MTDEEQKMNDYVLNVVRKRHIAVTERIYETMRIVRLYFYEINEQRQSLDHLRLQSQRLQDGEEGEDDGTAASTSSDDSWIE